MVRALMVGIAALLALPVAAATPDKATLAEIDRIFSTWALDAHVPGLAYGLVIDGKLVTIGTLGTQDQEARKPVTADTRFRIASMSKAFTALTILKLRDEGKLQLDAPAETYVPEMKGWTYPTTDSPKITVRNLLTHSSGFVEDNPWGDRQTPLPEADFTAMLKSGVPFSRAPGLAYEYSNLGYATLGRIVSNITHQRYEDAITGALIAPLGMRDTGYDVFKSPPGSRAIGYRWQDDHWLREPDMADGAFGAMGGIETTANDYAKWVEFLLSAWPARDGADAGPARRATVREIVTGVNLASGTLRAPAIGGTACRQAVAYGFAWRVLDDCDLGRVVTHTGGYPGYGSVVVLLPEKGVGIYAFSSRTYGAPSIPAFKALLALQQAGAIPDRTVPVSDGLAKAYLAAKRVYSKGDITLAPQAMNMPMDKDAAHWKAELAATRSAVGACQMEEGIEPISAMEGFFHWTCEHGRINGRVQRAPTPELSIQALSYQVATL